MKGSKISWTTHTFNPFRGCTKVSAGCANCYADAMNHRNPKTLGVWGPNGTRVVAAESAWKEPLKWDREAAARLANWERAVRLATSEYDCVLPYERPRVFCASLADVFEDWQGPMVDSSGKKLDHSGVWLFRGNPAYDPLTMSAVRDRLGRLIQDTPNLDWLLLTKRPEHVANMMADHMFGVRGDGSLAIPNNVWIGTSVENQQAADERIPHLLKVPARVRFLSCEPLLGPVEFSCVSKRSDAVQQLGKKALDGIHWVIVGGESSPNARPMHPNWARSLRDQCQAAGVAFHFKQWGEWAPIEGHRVMVPKAKGGNYGLLPSGERVYATDKRERHIWPFQQIRDDDSFSALRVGTDQAGRVLDGRTWDEVPSCS